MSCTATRVTGVGVHCKQDKHPAARKAAQPKHGDRGTVRESACSLLTAFTPCRPAPCPHLGGRGAGGPRARRGGLPAAALHHARHQRGHAPLPPAARAHPQGAAGAAGTFGPWGRAGRVGRRGCCRVRQGRPASEWGQCGGSSGGHVRAQGTSGDAGGGGARDVREGCGRSSTALPPSKWAASTLV